MDCRRAAGAAQPNPESRCLSPLGPLGGDSEGRRPGSGASTVGRGQVQLPGKLSGQLAPEWETRGLPATVPMVQAGPEAACRLLAQVGGSHSGIARGPMALEPPEAFVGGRKEPHCSMSAVESLGDRVTCSYPTFWKQWFRLPLFATDPGRPGQGEEAAGQRYVNRRHRRLLEHQVRAGSCGSMSPVDPHGNPARPEGRPHFTGEEADALRGLWFSLVNQDD